MRILLEWSCNERGLYLHCMSDRMSECVCACVFSTLTFATVGDGGGGRRVVARRIGVVVVVHYVGIDGWCRCLIRCDECGRNAKRTHRHDTIEL